MAIPQYLMHQSLQSVCYESQSRDPRHSAPPPWTILWRSDVACHSLARSPASFCAAGCTSMCHCARSWTDPGSQESRRGALSGRGGRRGRSLASLVTQQHKHAQCGRWVGWWVGVGTGWGGVRVSLHSPFPSFSIQLKVLDDPDTTEFWCSRRLFLLLFCFSFIYSSLYFLSTHQLPVHFTGLCWSHPPALLPSSLQFSSCGSLVPHLGNINMAAWQ